MSTTILNQAAQDAAKTLLTNTHPSYNFTFTPFLRENAYASLLTTPVCPDYQNGTCALGRRCPLRHPTPTSSNYSRQNDNYVCKHWLKGLCKKGDDCDYLHEYNLRKMSECQFYNQNGYCQNGDECLYVHVKEDSKLPLCEDYDQGFCEQGPRCAKRHVRRKLCVFYLAGFCPEGRACRNGVHLKSGTFPKKEEKQEERGRDFRGRGQKGNRWRDRKRRG